MRVSRGLLTMPIRLRLQYTRYLHWGRHSGFNQLAQFLDRNRFHVRIHAASDSDRDLPIPHAGIRHWLRTQVQKRGMPWYKLSDLAAELRAFPECLLRRTNIVHFLDGEHCPQYLPEVLKKSRLFHTRTIATYHQPPELLDDLVDPEVLSHIDHVTVVSPTQLAFFQKFLPSNRISLLLHGINTDFFRPDSRPRHNDIFKFITVGYWLRDWNAVRQVVEELRGEKNIEFHVVGNWETGLDNIPNVVSHRNINDATLRSLYQQSDMLFLPLTQSTANNTLLEGIACGLPVVSTNLPSIHAYLPGEEGILIKGNAPSLLIEAILKIKTDPDLRQRMAKQARIRAEELSWGNVAQKYEDLYTGLLS